jgi:hypothetical protein
MYQLAHMKTILLVSLNAMARWGWGTGYRIMNQNTYTHIPSHYNKTMAYKAAAIYDQWNFLGQSAMLRWNTFPVFW